MTGIAISTETILNGTKFNLFTRDKRKYAQIIDDHDQSKLSDSYLNILRRTIIFLYSWFYR